MPQTGLTYKINQETGHISSMIDNKDSVIQAIDKALGTEKFGYEIYGWLYGLDMEPFIGQDLDYIQTNLQKYIEECLLQDDRIISIDNFTVAQLEEIDSCRVYFDVNTTEGFIQGYTKELNYGS